MTDPRLKHTTGPDKAHFIEESATTTSIHVFWHNMKTVNGPQTLHMECLSHLSQIVTHCQWWDVQDQEIWKRWKAKNKFKCPCDLTCLLVWSHHTHFKYLQNAKTEAYHWKGRYSVDESAIPRETQSIPVAACSAKAYVDLDEEDLAILLHAHCQHALFSATSQVPVFNQCTTHFLWINFCPTVEHAVEQMDVRNGEEDSSGNDSGTELSDADVVRWIAAGKEATDLSAFIYNVLLVTVLQSPEHKAPMSVWDEHTVSVCKLLSAGHVVAIMGVVEAEPQLEWTERSLCSICRCSPNGGRIQWQWSQDTVKGTIHEFLKQAAQPNERANCLDLPAYGGSRPYIIG
ncbi:hypothetical protein BC835DRAFT_1310664 [Cytidiella melzeri]|nr:hypothetical protein BC835DRAFT_1310664 [Cytidiella melzeri]